jgi:hypothetical protein
MSYFQKNWEQSIENARKRVLIWERPFLPDIPAFDNVSEEVVVEEIRKLSPYIKRAQKRPLSWLNGLLKFVLTFIPIVILFVITRLENLVPIYTVIFLLIYFAGFFYVGYYFWSLHEGWLMFFGRLVVNSLFYAIIGGFSLFTLGCLLASVTVIVFKLVNEVRLRAYLNWFYIKIPYNL